MPNLIRNTCVQLLSVLPRRIRLALEARYYENLLSKFNLNKEPDLSLALEFIEPGHTVIDVGANIGLWTINLAKRVGRNGRTIAVEPVPTTFAILERVVNKVVNSGATILLHNCALSNDRGQIGMEVPVDGRGIRNHYLAKVVSGVGQITVDVRKLDDICASIRERIQFIKIDTEGHELSVLMGGVETLRTHQPVLCVEISTDPDDVESEGGRLIQLLSDLGYSCYVRRNDHLSVREKGEVAVNYFFQPTEITPKGTF